MQKRSLYFSRLCHLPAQRPKSIGTPGPAPTSLLYSRGPRPVGSQPFMIHRVRKAFVLGAGFGSRLRPLTNLLPKPLLPIYGKPLITFALDHLRQAGIEEF